MSLLEAVAHFFGWQCLKALSDQSLGMPLFSSSSQWPSIAFRFAVLTTTKQVKTKPSRTQGQPGGVNHIRLVLTPFAKSLQKEAHHEVGYNDSCPAEKVREIIAPCHGKSILKALCSLLLVSYSHPLPFERNSTRSRIGSEEFLILDECGEFSGIFNAYRQSV